MSMEPGTPDRQRDSQEENELEPVIEDARLPYMDSQETLVKRTMPAEDRIEAGEASLAPAMAVDSTNGSNERMAPWDEERAAPAGSQGYEPPKIEGDQRARDPGERDPRQPGSYDSDEGDRSGYVRLRLRLEKGRLRVVGARAVEGPLAFDESLQGDLVYEVRDGDRRIGIGVVPDAGQMRSFPPPEPQEGQVGHHIVPLQATEFNVRVRAEDLSAEALDRLRIDVYEMKAAPEQRVLSAEPVDKQFRQEARLVAQLEGLELQNMEPRVREDLKQALQ